MKKISLHFLEQSKMNIFLNKAKWAVGSWIKKIWFFSSTSSNAIQGCWQFFCLSNWVSVFLPQKADWDWRAYSVTFCRHIYLIFIQEIWVYGKRCIDSHYMSSRNTEPICGEPAGVPFVLSFLKTKEKHWAHAVKTWATHANDASGREPFLFFFPV